MATNQLSNTLLLTDIPALATRFQARVPDTLRVHIATSPTEAITVLKSKPVEVIISCPQHQLLELFRLVTNESEIV